VSARRRVRDVDDSERSEMAWLVLQVENELDGVHALSMTMLRLRPEAHSAN